MHSKAEFNWAAKEDPTHYCPFKAQHSVPFISAFATCDSKLYTLLDNEVEWAMKIWEVLFWKLYAEFPVMPPDSSMKILPKNKGSANSNEEQGRRVISVSKSGSEESGAE